MPENQITNISDIIKTLGIIIAVITLFLGYRNAKKGQEQNKKSRDLGVFLNLSNDFRNRWEGGWGDILDELGADHKNDGLTKVPNDRIKDVTYMLNWVDWLGTVIRTNILTNDEVIFGSIGIPIKRIINAGRPIIEKGIEEHKKEYWGSLLVVGQRLEVGWIKDLKLD